MSKDEQRLRIMEKIPWAPLPVWKSIDCDDGWLDMIEVLVDLAIVRGVKVLQIKEKFGGLRFYTGPFDDAFSAAIDAIEWLSLHTCEECGEDGQEGYDYDKGCPIYKATREQEGWIKTLCAPCRERRNG